MRSRPLTWLSIFKANNMSFSSMTDFTDLIDKKMSLN
jgi:hypothetical protein